MAKRAHIEGPLENSPIPHLAERLDWVAAVFYPSKGCPSPALFGKFAEHAKVLHRHGGRQDQRGKCMRFETWEQMEIALKAVLSLDGSMGQAKVNQQRSRRSAGSRDEHADPA